VLEAISRQAALLPHAMGDVHPAAIKVELLERLAALAPGDLEVTHLGLNGADALEAALKTAVLATGRPGIRAFAGAYHGLSYGALPLAGPDYFRAPFAAQLAPHVRRAPFTAPGTADFGVIESLLAEGGIGAVVIEPVQGRGGVRPAPPGLLPALATLCRRHGALLIADEIMTGLGRTGRWFAVEEEAVVPDLLLIGKALGGGLPLSAAIGSARVMAAWRGPHGPALHTSTFLGHPLAAAAALAVLDVITNEDLVAHAAAMGRRLGVGLDAALAHSPGVAAVRGRGLFAGIELRDPETGAPDGARASAVMIELCARGVLVLTAGEAGEVIELTPPLVITAAEIERGIEEIAAALARVPPGGTGE
jgi:4-aminobutyrate aminotransferase-like enzyme